MRMQLTVNQVMQMPEKAARESRAWMREETKAGEVKGLETRDTRNAVEEAAIRAAITRCSSLLCGRGWDR